MQNIQSQITATDKNIRHSDISKVIEDMKRAGMPSPIDKVFISIPDAKSVLQKYLSHFLQMQGRKLQWLPEYDHICEWLSDNKGLGLFMYGNCGRGKSFLGRYILPAILLKYNNKIVKTFDVQEMNKDPELLLSKHIIGIDDIGTEEVSNTFGNKRMVFGEIMDSVEKESKLIIISSNLQQKDLKEKYGDRILDRIKETTKRVLFEGESLRGKF